MRAHGPIVRAHHGAVRVPELESPTDTVHYRLYHRALWTGAEAELQTGDLPPDRSAGPWPVVVLLGGINIGPESYRWLATDLAESGYAVVIPALVGETLPGVIGITPGLDLGAVTPATYGTRPSGIALGPVLAELARLNGAGRFEELLDLDHLAFGGHSGGGSVVLQNADPSWFPGLRAVFTYASHLMASTMLGFEPATVLALPAETPALLLAGELDGVMAASAYRYARADDEAHDPVTETYLRSAVAPGSALAVLAGATHTALLHPIDNTTARGFLDPDPSVAPDLTRAACAELVRAFLDHHLRADATAWERLGGLVRAGRDAGIVARHAARPEW